MQTNTVIAVANEKGGTGKTTTAVSLAAALGDLGRRVLLVDLDGQAAASRWLGVEGDHRLAEALYNGKGLEPIPDVLPGVSLAPASGSLDSVSHNLRPTQGGQLRKVLSEVPGFEFTLIDCPPSLGNRLIGNALLAATHVIVPVETSILALDGLKILLTTLEDVREGFDHEIVLGGVLACRYDARTRLSPLVLAELKRALGGKVFETVIRENVKMRECPASGQSIFSFAPDSHAAEDYKALAREMLSHPEIWCRPAERTARVVGGPPATGEGLAVAELRENAAARVRASTRRPDKPPPAEVLTEPVATLSATSGPDFAEAPSASCRPVEEKPTPPIAAPLAKPSDFTDQAGVAPAEADRPESRPSDSEAPPAPSAEENHTDGPAEEYPALRSLLRQMVQELDSSAAQDRDPQAEREADDDETPPIRRADSPEHSRAL